MISINPKDLHKNREKFISETSNLPRHEATRLWSDELYQSSGNSTIIQVLSQILQYDIIVVNRDTGSLQL